MSDILLFEQDGPIVTLTLNRPDIRNPLGETEDADSFSKAVQRINDDMTVKAVILTGAGPAFSAGGNIRKMRERMEGTPEQPHATRARYKNTVHRLVRAIWSIEVPLIAAVNGPAIGLGNDVTCLADIRIASEKALFGATFLRMGLVPGDGGAWILPRILGVSRAAEMLFTASTFDAATAEKWGFVSKVVAPDDLMREAKSIAAKICEQAGPALRMTKQLLREGMNGSYDVIMELSATMQSIAHMTPEHHQAVEAFLAKSKR